MTNSDTDEDEVPDYSTLFQRSRRGQKENIYSASQEEAIQQSRDALFSVIDEKKKVSDKNLSHGILDRATGLTTLTRSKGTHLRVMGHSIKGSMTLYPEEAAWLINMNALHVPDATLETYFGLMFTNTDKWISFEKYQVYAYLRRLGYIVHRHSTPQRSSADPTMSSSLRNRCQWLIHTLIRLFKHAAVYLFGTKPLIRHGQCSTFESVYSTLRIIPSSPWYKPFTDRETLSFDWDVYRPNPQWKKRSPGVPDFRVAVASAREAVPSLAKYQQLFGDLEQMTRPSDSYHPIRYTKPSNLAFLLAVVEDTGGISFLRIAGDGVIDIS
ncbi:hypothetical protein BJV82DRAFT_656669 [Fennellomyces sp. T-0311]|nr:hypothetical protein BJV82DRAFT_656669 [Fennellomyces sp. T-0311]